MDNVIVGEIHPAPGELAPGLRTWTYPHFKDVYFDRFDTELGMIIGASHVHLWIPGNDIKIGKKNEPIALLTKFGWTVMGGGGGGKPNYATSNAITATNAELASNLDRIFFHDFSHKKIIPSNIILIPFSFRNINSISVDECWCKSVRPSR